jgi:hypothetical protein
MKNQPNYLMKKLLFCTTFLFAVQLVSQEKLGRPFFTGSFNFTLGINENYTFEPDDGEALIEPAALFFRVGIGYEFKRRLAISLNAGYDYHWNYAVSAFPTYGTLRYNLSELEDDAFFVEMSYGKMWRPLSSFSDGNYYGFGIGSQIAGEKRWNTIVRIDFHRKGLLGFENNRLDSVSLGIGFIPIKFPYD